MVDELTVLDYVKALLSPWRGAPPPIPPLGEIKASDPALSDQIEDLGEVEVVLSPEQVNDIPADDLAEKQAAVIPWKTLAALGFAFIAQISLEPAPARSWGLGFGLYIVAAALVIWASLRGDWNLPVFPAARKQIDNLEVRWVYLAAGAILSLLAFITLGGNRFTLINSLLWILSIFFISVGFFKVVEKL